MWRTRSSEWQTDIFLPPLVVSPSCVCVCKPIDWFEVMANEFWFAAVVFFLVFFIDQMVPFNLDAHHPSALHKRSQTRFSASVRYFFASIMLAVCWYTFCCFDRMVFVLCWRVTVLISQLYMFFRYQSIKLQVTGIPLLQNWWFVIL